MSPQIKSVLSSVLMSGATAIAAWGASHGVVPNADQNVIANDLVTAAFAAITALLGWYKAHQASPQAQITAINSDKTNGVRVVAASVPEALAPQVNAPLK